MNPARLRTAPNIAIVGSSSPLGRELKEMVEDSDLPVGKLSLVETEEYAGLLQEFAGEIQITQIISPETFSDVDIAFFACSPEIMNSYAASGAAFPELTIDLTQTGRDGTLFLNGISDSGILKDTRYLVNPHPAAIVLARVLSCLHRGFGIQMASITILEPASERGFPGVDELQEQTVSLLNFQHVEHRIFEGQIAFNVMSESEGSQRTETVVGHQIGTLLGETTPAVRIMAVQVPVFHSHSFSMFVQLLSSPTVEELNKSLGEERGAIALHDPKDLPSPVSVVGTDKVHVGRVSADPNHPGAFSLWFVADNLRIAAANALQTAESIMFAPASQR